ncbi:hypothetical protein COY59_04590 [Candidatus Gottesmanbacteria bacterium CG_4_10_14_0_8_um_filter_37_24]|uniref:Uncharacterized protein n=2 Tax=Candidatus Gottesmaniibacteriota TaxID=1752720 RepID=A0A2M7RQ45_9BACT|nr:MAG: hypothetical protein AUJ73_02845 [Candidatus Gottesmanbacteria bacterium CG1_02_37_22]PIZ02451.1 MAG: hypothetical protein COY59_04590 [Candidatus Gottesmanbacteria bacterium CG_4_10_14_0_8_um_filter_37_24]
MQEDLIKEIKGKIVGGVFALTTRTLILQIISFIATFILTIILSPSIFGIFFVVSAVISFLSYFSDVGLAASLIQKKEDPTRQELVSVFTLQQLIVGSLVLLAIIFSPNFGKFYSLNSDGIFLLRALLISFFLSSLKTIPSILLERKLEFSLLVIPQILETFVFYLTTIVLALLGYGIFSFAWGSIARGVVGLVTIYVISPWKLSIGIDMGSLKKLLSFGLPFQMNSLLALVKDDLMTIFLGKILPFSQMGYIGWAKKWSEAPLRLIMDSIIRVTFPAFSRMQGDKKLLSKAISKSFFFLSFFIFPTTALLIIYIKPMIYLIPKYLKWEPALVPFYLYSFAAVLAAFSSPIVNALNAIGKIKKTLILMILWTLLTWILVPYLTLMYGYYGAPFAAFAISFTVIIPIFMIRKYIYIPILTSILKPIVSTCFMVVPILLILSFGINLLSIGTSLILGIIVYSVSAWLMMKNELLPYFPKFIRNVSRNPDPFNPT